MANAEKILAKYKRAKEKRQHKDSVWNELDLFDRGEQWSASHTPPWVPRSVTNYIHLVKTTKRASLAIENPVGKLRALSPFDIESIESLQKIYEHEWRSVGARKVIREVIETAKLLGTGIMQLYWEENTGVLGGTNTRFEGKIMARQIDPASFYPDPMAFTLEDCQFVHIVERKHVAWLKKHPLFKAKMGDVDERDVALEERGEIYSRDYGSTAKGIIDFHTHYEKIPLSDEGGFKYKVTYLAGDKIVHVIEDLQPRCYPFSILYDYPQRQDFWGKGTCEIILENQKIINKVESMIALLGTMFQNPQKVVHRKAGINPEELRRYGSAPGHTWISNIDPARSIHWVTPPSIPQPLFNLAEQAKQNIREITGLTEAYMGQNVGSLQTSSGVHSLIERATLRDRDQMYDLELFIEDFSRKLIKFVTTKYDETRYAVVLKDKYDDDFEFLPFVGTDYNMMDFDFVIDVSAKAPISRAKQRDDMTNLLNIQGQYGFQPPVITPQEFVKSQEYANVDELLERMREDELRNRTAEALQVAQMMMMAMQQGIPEEEAQSMAMAMIEQMDAQGGIGSASVNSGDIQMQQQGVAL